MLLIWIVEGSVLSNKKNELVYSRKQFQKRRDMQDLEIKKVIGYWRVWVKGAWCGSFVSEQDARRVADRMLWNKMHRGYDISLYHFEITCQALNIEF